MSSITTHVLDTAAGKPAKGIAVVVELGQAPERWLELARGVTDANGRIAEFKPPLARLKPGIYRIRFATREYFAAMRVRAFYPEVHAIVQIDDASQAYHIPLLLSPFGYTTYRGS
jgi:5-hydroxyisourate hydrolase